VTEVQIPNFYDEADEERHQWLLARGYRYYGREQLRNHAFLYQKRFAEWESEHWDADKFLVNVVRSDLSDLVRKTYPVNYEVDFYCERTDGVAMKVLLYAFGAERLEECLPELEETCMELWQKYARKYPPEESA
jgi:hypothetical protein